MRKCGGGDVVVVVEGFYGAKRVALASATISLVWVAMTPSWWGGIRTPGIQLPSCRGNLIASVQGCEVALDIEGS